MKTIQEQIEEASLENSRNHYIMAFSDELHQDADMDFRAGIEFANKWYKIKEELPPSIDCIFSEKLLFKNKKGEVYYGWYRFDKEQFICHHFEYYIHKDFVVEWKLIELK